MLKFVLLSLLVAVCAAKRYESFFQVHHPRTPYGYAYNGGSNDAPIKIDIYGGMQCEDAAAAWPVIKKVADHYGPNTLQLKFHVFPLPYFSGAFISSKGVRCVAIHNASLVIDYIDSVFANQDIIGRAPCTVSDLEKMELLTDFAVDLGVVREKFYNSFANPALTNFCKQEWKATVASGIYGSPHFKLNDVHVIDYNLNWGVEEWKARIDPLLAPPVSGEFTSPGIMW